MNKKLIICILLFGIIVSGCEGKPTKPFQLDMTHTIDLNDKEFGTTKADLLEADTTTKIPKLSLPKEGWIDAHVHCSPPKDNTCSDIETCCKIEPWQTAHKTLGLAAAALLSTEHVAVLSELGEQAGPLDPALLYKINEAVEGATQRDPSLLLFPSLECWYDTLLTNGEDEWIRACKEDVDRWVGKGAYGFKDHVGKQFDDNGKFDGGRWLGAWNRLNRFCDPTDQENPNRACMEESTVHYPTIGRAWREVLRYIVEEKKRVILTHATSYPGSENCYDPITESIRSCGDVTQSHLLDLAAWAKLELSIEARRRIVVAHLGFMSGDPLMQFLNTGLSVDIAIPIKNFGKLGCKGRQGLGLYPNQVLFGTDRKVGASCAVGTWDAWMHALSGKIGDTRNFMTCFGRLPIKGMELGSPSVPGCQFDVPDGLLKKISGDNFRRLYETQ